MNNHQDLDSMLGYIHESIKRDCERFIMNRTSSGLLPKIKPNLDTVIWWNHLNNYTKGLKITKWSVPYITKEMRPDMEDDEIEYANVMWNRIFGDKPYTSDLNNIEPKNPWLERKTKKK